MRDAKILRSSDVGVSVAMFPIRRRCDSQLALVDTSCNKDEMDEIYASYNSPNNATGR